MNTFVRMKNNVRLRTIPKFTMSTTTSNKSISIMKKYNIEPQKHSSIHYNLSYEDIFKKELNETGKLTNLNTVSINTGIFTGRSPKDKYFVEQEPSNKKLWWGDVNKPIENNIFNELYKKVVSHYNKSKEVFIFDCYVGANIKTRKKIRFITEYAWQHHFVKNMFIEPTIVELENDFENVDFTVINACNISNDDYKEHGLNSNVFVAFNIENRLALIGGTHYGGEMKKGIFSMMNYWLPLNNIMSMHCSANISYYGQTSLFFGLSGTGKTTLSVDKNRMLIGDDEHGWDDSGIFNFEGGCYAKTINLSPENEPEIYNAIKRDALLENIFIDDEKKVDFYNSTITENGRVSYPLTHIANRKDDSQGNHPTNIFFLSCDAFGVLPPISKLTNEQAMYYFLSGYTAKVAGTERGITEPQATFSACFGAAFLTLHPTIYADLLKEKIHNHHTNVYLVNTGWSGGSYGVGKRMSIQTTRACINSVLDGVFELYGTHTFPRFEFQVPQKIANVDVDLLTPIKTWTNKSKYHTVSQKLIDMFQNNYKQFQHPEMTDYSKHGPK